MNSAYIYGTQKKCTEGWTRNNMNTLTGWRLGPAERLKRSEYRRHIWPQGKLNHWNSV